MQVIYVIKQDVQQDVYYTIINPMVFQLNSFILDIVVANRIYSTNCAKERGGINSVSENQPRTGLKLSMGARQKSNDGGRSYWAS